MFGMPAWLFWLILAIAMLIVEGMTVNMTTIWFAVGAIVALLLSLWDIGIFTQVTVMIIVSAFCLMIFLLLVRPRMNRAKNVATNADRLLDQEGLVTEVIDPLRGTGRVKVIGQDWGAITEHSEILPVDTPVRVVALRGIKLLVKPLDSEDERKSL